MQESSITCFSVIIICNHQHTIPGPMPNTVSDFWRMIWEKRLPNIVMLTKCMEAGRVSTHGLRLCLGTRCSVSSYLFIQRKCEQYWGENVGDDFETPDHKLTITTTYVLPLADFNIRTFTVESVSTELTTYIILCTYSIFCSS